MAYARRLIRAGILERPREAAAGQLDEDPNRPLLAGQRLIIKKFDVRDPNSHGATRSGRSNELCRMWRRIEGIDPAIAGSSAGWTCKVRMAIAASIKSSKMRPHCGQFCRDAEHPTCEFHSKVRSLN
jgi:hypothetical protein